MKRRKGNIAGLGPAIVLTAALVLASSLIPRGTAFAEDRQGASGWQVTFDGKKMSSNFTTANIGDEINLMQPGDSVELTITLKNACSENADWYMKNEVLSTLEDAGDAAGGAYDYLLVRGHRVPYDGELESTPVESMVQAIQNYYMLYLLLGLGVTVLGILTVRRVMKRKERQIVPDAENKAADSINNKKESKKQSRSGK
ncbi:MAG: hypothetical protein K1W22_01630 [Lachnospiraceae bacterium]